MSDLLSPGASVARYRIQAEVGHGGMGVVYRAVDPVLNRPVALKVLAPHMGRNPLILARFHREAASIANLRHPHIAVIYEYGEQAGQPYIALEWLEGKNLQAILNEAKPLALDRALRLFDQLAGALDYAHASGVIHRDVKPSNIIVGQAPDGGEHATLVDFGLAHMAAAPAITASTDVFGSPAYMSPEQISGKRLDGRSDLYSLAVVVYEMLAGRLPFGGDTGPALMHAHLYDPPLPITEIEPNLPQAIEGALLKALAKDPAERFATAADFGAALRRAESGPSAGHERERTSPPGVTAPTVYKPAAPPASAPEIASPRPSPRLSRGQRLGFLAVLGFGLAAGAGLLLFGQLNAKATGSSAATASPHLTPGATEPPNASPTFAPDATSFATTGLTATVFETQVSETDTPSTVLAPSLTPAPPTASPTATLIPSETPTPIMVTPYPTPVESGVWTMPAADAAQTGLVPDIGQLYPSPRWSRPPLAGGTGLVVAGGLVIFGADQGTVRELDWTEGRTISQSAPLGDNVSVAPLGLYLGRDVQLVFVATDSKRLLALRLADLSVAWQKTADDLQGTIYGGVTIGPDGTVYAATDTGWLHAWNPANGQPAWPAVDLTQTDGFGQPPAVAGDAIYLAGGNQAVYKIDAASRQTIWRVEIVGVPATPPSVAQAASLLFVGTASGRVHAIALKNGAEAWKAETSGALAGLANDGSRVYATTTNGNVYAWDAAMGGQLWVDNMNSSLAAAPLTDSHFVLVATQQGELRFLDATTGQESPGRKLALPNGDSIGYTPALAGGWLFVRANSIYGFGP